jgi:O-antigen/teichoic acid export membrane protein
MSRAVTFGTGVVLARLLGPHAFGAYAIALVALFAMQTFNELGMGAAIVRWERDPREIAPTITTISVLASLIAFIGCYAAAPAYASAMGDPAASSVVRVLAIAILIDGFCNTPSGLLQRQFRQGRSTIAVQTGGWIGTGVTVYLAWSGHGAMSLAIGQVVGSLICMILLVAFAPGSLRMGFNRARARELFGYGIPLAGSNLVAFAVTTVDQVVVGHALGAEALGFYVLAFNVANWPVNIFSTPVRNVTPALFSRLQHDRAALRRTFLTALGLLSAIGLPLCLLIAGSAKPLIGMVYGAHWLPAAEALRWLAILAALRILFEIAYDYLIVLAHSRFVLVVQLVWMLALVPALIIGTRAAGIAGAGAAEAAVAAFAVLPWYMGGLRKAGIKVTSILKQISMPAVAAIAAGLIATVAGEIARSNFIALAGSAAITATAVGLLIYRMRPALAMLRTASAAESGAEPSTDAASTAEEPYDDDLTAQLAAMWGVIDALPHTGGEVAEKMPVLGYGLFSAAGFHRSMTETMPIYRDMPGFMPRGLDATSPLYRSTVASLQLDPARGRDRSPARPPAAPSGNGRGRPANERDTDPRGQALRWDAAKEQRSSQPRPPAVPSGNGRGRPGDERDTDPYGQALPWDAAKTRHSSQPRPPAVPSANGRGRPANERDTDPYGQALPWDAAKEQRSSQPLPPAAPSGNGRGRPGDERDTDPFAQALRWDAAREQRSSQPLPPAVPSGNGRGRPGDERDTDPFTQALRWHAAREQRSSHPRPPAAPSANGRGRPADERDTDPFGIDPVGQV